MTNEVSLKDYFERLLLDLKELLEAKLQAIEQASVESKRLMEARMKDFPQDFLSKADYAAGHKTIEDAIGLARDNFGEKFEELAKSVKGLETFQANINGRITATGAAIFIGLVIVQVIIHIIWGK